MCSFIRQIRKAIYDNVIFEQTPEGNQEKALQVEWAVSVKSLRQEKTARRLLWLEWVE